MLSSGSQKSVGFNLNDFLSYSCTQGPSGSDSQIKYKKEPNCFAPPQNRSCELSYGKKAMEVSSGNSHWMPEDPVAKTNLFFSRIPGWMVWLLKKDPWEIFFHEFKTGKESLTWHLFDSVSPAWNLFDERPR